MNLIGTQRKQEQSLTADTDQSRESLKLCRLALPYESGPFKTTKVTDPPTDPTMKGIGSIDLPKALNDANLLAQIGNDVEWVARRPMHMCLPYATATWKVGLPDHCLESIHIHTRKAMQPTCKTPSKGS
ncbi:hypothetical protein VNO77_19061 [Canavalia gladiata]|uniref:Uncharacterized protein n=1 Tax=Canavalia gladiata TaxID=3824 RepID=A0AAN9QL09_CANGL